MNVSCDITIEFDNKEKAKNVLKSVEVDNFNFVKTKINGAKLESKINSSSVSSMLHTLDDYLACVSIAAKVVDKD